MFLSTGLRTAGQDRLRDRLTVHVERHEVRGLAALGAPEGDVTEFRDAPHAAMGT